MEILRAYQVIKQDGMNVINTISNTADQDGNVTKLNNRSSSYIMDETINSHLKAVEDYLMDKLNPAEEERK